MGLVGDILADLIEMQLHRLSVGLGKDECCTGASLRADGTEQIGIFIALIGRQAWPGSLFRPDTCLVVLLADPCLILEPYLDRRFFRQISYVRCECIGEVFLKASIT